MKKIVMSLDVHDEKSKQKAMKAVSSLPGVESISIDMKEGKLTVTGDVDAVQIVKKLRKKWHTDIAMLGPLKDEKKEAEAKKKKEQEEEEKKKRKNEEREREVAALLEAYHDHSLPHACLINYDHPSACVIT